MKPFLISEFFNDLDLEQLTIVQCMKFTLEQIPTNLSQLQIRDCALSNLNGISAMKNLKTLTVQHSRTQDISDLRELNLEALYLDEKKSKTSKCSKK
ncbi:Leucine-rich_repeat domain superfamily [Hexamita inflata]|uniref:Leucine-rich repeat domain superfamily n=1 Tax=Hexamita inflata TaxID=28002 RepID=A0AA86QH84_9EUKA|nr:Leucine-rich repeat domain superfamily [Hexamita inflata]